MRTLIRPGAFQVSVGVPEPTHSGAAGPPVSQAEGNEPATLTVICSWCDRVLREGTGRVTHTICEPCMERVLGDAA